MTQQRTEVSEKLGGGSWEDVPLCPVGGFPESGGELESLGAGAATSSLCEKGRLSVSWGKWEERFTAWLGGCRTLLRLQTDP